MKKTISNKISLFLLCLGTISCKTNKFKTDKNQFSSTSEIKTTERNKSLENNNLERATIITDTIENDYRNLSTLVTHNYIPTEKDLITIDKKIKRKYASTKKNFYRQYRGFRTKEKDTVIEVGILTKYGVKKFPEWENKPYEIIEMHKKSKKVQFVEYLYFTTSGDLLNSDNLRIQISKNLKQY